MVFHLHWCDANTPSRLVQHSRAAWERALAHSAPRLRTPLLSKAYASGDAHGEPEAATVRKLAALRHGEWRHPVSLGADARARSGGIIRGYDNGGKRRGGRTQRAREARRGPPIGLFERLGGPLRGQSVRGAGTRGRACARRAPRSPPPPRDPPTQARTPGAPTRRPTPGATPAGCPPGPPLPAHRPGGPRLGPFPATTSQLQWFWHGAMISWIVRPTGRCMRRQDPPARPKAFRGRIPVAVSSEICLPIDLHGYLVAGCRHNAEGPLVASKGSD
eukprot:scaffold1353_cov417-Prasinococcus_capsulatus_cf.AAC.7